MYKPLALFVALFLPVIAACSTETPKPVEPVVEEQPPVVPVHPEPVVVEEGKAAPDFTLLSQAGEPVTLSSFRGTRNVVLYFYPKDNTPGCTVEACSFRDAKDQFAGTDTVILGVSVDDVASHATFVGDQNLNFTLLADPAFTVTRLYNVETTFHHDNREIHFANRVTFVIDKQGILRKIYPQVDPTTHANQVLTFVKTLTD